MNLFTSHNFSLFFSCSRKETKRRRCVCCFESQYQGLACLYRTSQGGKNVNGDFVVRPKLMNNPLSIGKILQVLRQ